MTDPLRTAALVASVVRGLAATDPDRAAAAAPFLARKHGVSLVLVLAALEVEIAEQRGAQA